MMVTHFTHALGVAHTVQPLDAFYPVTFPDRIRFLRKAEVVEAMGMLPHLLTRWQMKHQQAWQQQCQLGCSSTQTASSTQRAATHQVS